MHNIEYRTYDENCNRDSVYNDINKYVQHETYGEGGHGIDGIRWLDRVPVCKDEDEAKEVIHKNDKGFYDNLAVKYHAAKLSPTTAKEINLQAKMQKQHKAIRDLEDVVYPQTLTSNMIGCKECGSRLAKQYLTSNYCPVCRKDLRPPYMQDKIAKAMEAYRKTSEAYKELMHRGNKIKWLVKFEYHT